VRDHPRLTVPPSLQQRIEALLSPLPLVSGQPIVVFHTGPTWAIREWPLASWHELVGRLRADGFQNLIHVGASKNAFIGEQPTDTIPGVISLVDKLTLEETIGLIARANLLVGIDSGLLHMAAGVQTPFVGVWGPTSPNLRFSDKTNQTAAVSQEPCQGCHHRLPCLHWISGCQNDIRCMRNLRPADVLAACHRQLPSTK